MKSMEKVREQHGWPLTPSFENYLKLSENDKLLNSMVGTRKLNKVRHESPEGGTDTAGFGHKMTQGEHDSGYINGVRVSAMTRDDINALFYRDQSDAWERLEGRMDVSNMNVRQREMLFDMEYTVKGGIDSFPKFTKAVVDKDWPTALQESKRYYTNAETGKKEELATRNQQFAAQFFNKAARDGDYTSIEAQDSSQESIARIRKGMGQEALSEARKTLPAGAEEAALMQQSEQIQKQKFQEEPQQQAPQQAPQALASNTPAPNIDLKGMLSKEHVAPSGEKGMLSPLTSANGV
jgi:hypothetical protein